MTFNQQLDRLAREAHATTAAATPDPSPADQLQAALDELVADARQWSVQRELLARRRAAEAAPAELDAALDILAAEAFDQSAITPTPR